ncbi:TlpA disulfide reductase family protein [Sphingobacterium sp.]|uniref:TlpA family protein disulfide reductase n=1 Tax=Sphingobacterium sp. TaxID=341027 RepID=UPI0031CFFB95
MIKTSKSFTALLDKVVLIMLFALFSMFSLSAQTPRKDSGANGPTPLQIGDKVPDTFWTQEHLFFIDGDTVRRNLAQLKGKLLVLDFWSTTCASCIFQQKEIEFFKKSFASDIAVVMVNPLKTKDNYDRIQRFYQRYYKGKPGKHLNTIILDGSLQSMFRFMGYPHYVWINKYEYVQTQTFRNLLDRNYVAPFIDMQP